MPMISRVEMEAAIRAGGSVILPGGRIVSTIEQLPPELDLAKDDPARAAARRADVEAEIARLRVELNHGQPVVAEATADA